MELRETTEREWVKTCMTELCRKAGFADCHKTWCNVTWNLYVIALNQKPVY